MALHPRSPIVRARQRSRTALPAFTAALDPQFEQTGVDRLQVRLHGTWRASAGNGSDVIAQEYKDLLATSPLDIDWLTLPENNRTNVRIKSRATPRSTISELDINVTGWPDRSGQIICKATVNPTRTLAHLMVTHPADGSFVQRVTDLPPALFFAPSTGVTPGFGGPNSRDNWIEDADAARDCLGNDIASEFGPIFARQLLDLVTGLVAPRHTTRRSDDGADIVLNDPGLEVRLECGTIRVPQIETYFERHHAAAVAGVRAAVAAALITIEDARAVRYENRVSEWMARMDDSLALGFDVARERKIAVYAKHRRRLRFEVRRLRAGAYASLPVPSSPVARLVDILAMERRTLLTICRWSTIGDLFEEPNEPTISDLSRLCTYIAEACADQIPVEPVMSRLLEDGGLNRGGEHGVPAPVVESLIRNGVLDRTIVRRRDRGVRTSRVALRPEYRAIIDAVARTLVTEEPR